ncbi:MAG: RnfH family protein [Limnohabitans sp.]
MAETLVITVCFSPSPRVVHDMPLRLDAGATLTQAVALATQQPGWPPDWPPESCHALTPGIWGRKVAWGTVLREGDRVELYRNLRVDPKVARRERFRQQGSRRAGLFAQKRPDNPDGQ